MQSTQKLFQLNLFIEIEHGFALAIEIKMASSSEWFIYPFFWDL